MLNVFSRFFLLFAIGAFVFGSPLYAKGKIKPPHSSSEEDDENAEQTESKSKDTDKKKKKPKKLATEDFGISAGLMTFLPPYPSIQINVVLPKDFQLGFEFGYVAFSSTEFSIKSSYMGIDFKYGMFSSDAIFYGLGLGTRKINVDDSEEYRQIVPNETTGASTEQVSYVTWISDISQTLIMPRVGWKVYRKKGMSMTISLGIAAPIGSRHDMTRDVETIPGKSAADLDGEKDQKIKDIDKYATATLPLLSFGFNYYFDVW